LFHQLQREGLEIDRETLDLRRQLEFSTTLDAALREYLRIVISVALSIAPRAVKRAYADRYDESYESAKRQLSQAAADAVLQSFDIERKPDASGPSPHSRFMSRRE
jgi:hypothetical protein